MALRIMKMKGTFETHRLYQQLIRKFVKWARICQDIRGAIIIGSRARHDHAADEWADLDVIVITTKPDRYVLTDDWVKNIGKPLLTFVEPTSTGEATERRVLYDGMLDVDFAIISKEKAQQFLQTIIAPQTQLQLANVFGRGMQIIIDKDGILSSLQILLSSTKTSPTNPPTEQEFLQVVNDFLYHGVFTAKHLRRGELWWAKMCSDCHMQSLLLRMIEWHAHATHDLSYDTWFRGRFLEEWAEPRVLEEMQNTFAHYDKTDISRALLAIMDLFRWASIETADKLDYSYPTKVEQQITEWIKACLSECMK